MSMLVIIILYIAMLATCATLATFCSRMYMRRVLTRQERDELIAQQAAAQRESLRLEVERLLRGDDWHPTVCDLSFAPEQERAS